MDPVQNKTNETPATINQKNVEGHKKIASHLENAAKYHLAAAKHHEEGNHERAAQSTLIAQGHLGIAAETQRENTMRYAQSN